MDVSGAGHFTCGTAPASNGQAWTQLGLTATVPIQTTTIPNPAKTFSGFVDSPPFVYNTLDCGTHQYADMPQAEDFTVISGTLTMQGSETPANGGTKQTITLNLTQ
jgi:hypothetical protein